MSQDRQPRGVISTWWQVTSRGLPRPFWILLAGTFVNRLGQMVLPFLALYLSGPRDLSPSTVGVVLACWGVGSLASQPLGGYLADRFGRRITLVLGMVGTAASYLALAAVRDIVLIGAAAALSGLAVDIYRPAVSAMVADLVAPEHRARAYALIYWAINLGVAVAGLLGGWMAERSFWLLFVADAITCLAFAALIASKVPETRPEPEPTAATGYSVALRDGLLVALSLSGLLGGTVYLQSLITLPLAVEADGLGPAAFGIIYAVNPVVVVVSQIFVVRVIDQIAGVRLLVVSYLLMGVGFWLTTFASSVPAFAATVVVWTLGEVAFNAIGPALVAEIAPVHMRGRYIGVFGTSYGAAALLAPLIGTWLFDVGEPVLWSACLVGCLAGGAIVAALAPAIARRRAALAQLSR